MSPSPSSHLYNLYLLIYTTLYLALQLLLSALSLPKTLHSHLFHDGSRYLETNYHTHGSYALITGSTDGIGRAFALELAERGWNIVLHGRHMSRIHPLLEQLREAHPRQTFLPLPLDATSISPGAIGNALAELGELRITLFISNAGALPPVKAFAALNDEDVIDNVHVNITFGVLLLKALMNGVLAERACVLLMGSIGSIMTLPGTPTYSASKCYGQKFSACLRTQLASANPTFSTPYAGLEILPILVGGVRTKMTPISEDGNIMFVTPRVFARSALSKVGLGREVFGYFWHEAQMWCLTVWPEEGGMRGWVNALMMRGVDKMRAEGWRRLGEGARMVDGRLVG